MSKEMSHKFHLQNYTNSLQLLSDIHNHPQSVINYFQETEYDGSASYEAIKNYTKYYFKLNRGCLKLENSKTPWEKISEYESIGNEEALFTLLRKLEFWKTIKVFARIRKRHIRKYKFYFVDAIKYYSDPNSLGNGCLYAISNFAKRRLPRYDFVLVKMEVSDSTVQDDDEYSLGDGKKKRRKSIEMNRFKTILAKVILFICVIKSDLQVNNDCYNGIGSDEDEEQMTHIFCLIQELYPTKQGNVPNYQLGKIFEWAADPDNKHNFRYHVVPVESILRPWFVVPKIHRHYRTNRPSFHDFFYMLDSKFFDRCSDWNDQNSFPDNFVATKEQVESLLDENMSRLCYRNNTSDIYHNHGSINSKEESDMRSESINEELESDVSGADNSDTD